MSIAARNFLAVFSKEVRDNLRDRRSIFSSLMSSLIGPVIILAMIVILGKSLFKEVSEKPLPLPVVGAENAPSLVHYLEQNNVEVLSPPNDPESEVRNGNLDVVLVIPDTYGEDFSSGFPASVQIIYDSSRQSAIPAVERARSAIRSYEGQISSLRLMARGINPGVADAIAMETLDVATPQSQVLIFLNMMPYFVVLVVFVGGMYVIIDTTAGERERGSLEPLLIIPIPRWSVVLGKLGAAVPFATFAVFLTLAAFGLTFNFFPLEDYVGIQLTIDVVALAGIFLIALPMILLASALQMIVATFTRSFKEAQTYVAFLPLIPALPGIGLAFLPVKANIWIMLIPTFGQQLLINQLMRGEPVNLFYAAVNTLGTIAVAGILTIVAIKLYQREQILFGPK
jgi:sodium transport system permease protein